LTEVSVDYNSPVNEHTLSPVQKNNHNRSIEMDEVNSALLDRDLHKINDWEELLPPFLGPDGERDVDGSPGTAMNQLFGVGNYKPSVYLR